MRETQGSDPMPDSGDDAEAPESEADVDPDDDGKSGPDTTPVAHS